MNMNRAMGLNSYSEAIDSTRGKSRRSQLFLKSNRSDCMLVCQRVRQPNSDPAALPLGARASRPLALPKKRARRPRSQEASRRPIVGPPKTEGPEIRPLSDVVSLRPRNLRRAAAVRRRRGRLAAATERIEIERRWRAGRLSRRRPGVLDDRSWLAIDARQN